MRLALLLLLVACGKKQPARDVVPDVKARFSAVLAKLATDAPPCQDTPRDKTIRIQLRTLRRLAGAPDLPNDDPNTLIHPINFESGLPDRYLNPYNPPDSTQLYGRALLDLQQAIVLEIEKLDKFTYSGEAFTPATAHVRAVVFDLATGTPTCVQRYDVKNSEKVWVEYRKTQLAPTNEAIETELLRDLSFQFSLSGPTRPNEPDNY